MKTIPFALLLCSAAFPQSEKYPIRKPGEIQVPKGKWQVPGEIQKVKEQCTSKLIVGSDALFAFDKSELSPEAAKILSGLGPMIAKEGKHPITVAGYTDSIGSADYNQQLSQKRAKAVEEWLVAHEVLKPGTAQVQGFGKNKPVAPNTKPDGSDNPEGRQKNRRVEILIDTCK